MMQWPRSWAHSSGEYSSVRFSKNIFLEIQSTQIYLYKCLVDLKMSACSGGERSDGGSGGWEANDAGGKPGGWGKHTGNAVAGIRR